ncbi:hypothetical protein EB796_017677 [Bugula neritina]|uniref:Uncharacterized protein n=1 Tax=Bugula neritina TaxID=10212 RepID=A0A7J7JF67_BUGNE|nr:hypothetical protein EB796_017677 [Bugula neritina]
MLSEKVKMKALSALIALCLLISMSTASYFYGSPGLYYGNGLRYGRRLRFGYSRGSYFGIRRRFGFGYNKIGFGGY